MPRPATFLQGSGNDLGLFFCLRKPLGFTSVSLLPWLVPQVHSNILVLSLRETCVLRQMPQSLLV